MENWIYIVYWTVSQMVVGQCGMHEKNADMREDFCDRAKAVYLYERQKNNEGYQLELGITIKNVELDSIVKRK